MVEPAKSIARTVVVPVDITVPVESVVALFAGQRRPAILESSRQADGYGRFSIFAREPVAEFRIDDPSEGCPLGTLAERMAEYPVVEARPLPVPFCGGWIGFLSYEAGLWTERIGFRKEPDGAVPLARFCLYDTAAVYDHVASQWYLTAVDWPADGNFENAPVRERLDRIRRDLVAAADRDLPCRPGCLATPLSSGMSREDYLARVKRIKGYIEAGDVYQVNLTQRFTARTNLSPLDLYLRLRAISPSSHAALISWDETAIISSSPELFLDLRAGTVTTRPIKGTRPRDADPLRDAALRRELDECPKELAELNMIVDLLRNDLGRVCSFGTVRVVSAGEIEEHPTVFHRVATIEGGLRSGLSWIDLLRATFPGGSVTGAPKIRAMQIIEELEPTPRGVYCGSVGWIGLDGSMSLNIAIRTMVQRGNRVHAYAGGAIVADSTPEAEYSEVGAKLAGMARALGCRLQSQTPQPIIEEVTAL